MRNYVIRGYKQSLGMYLVDIYCHEARECTAYPPRLAEAAHALLKLTAATIRNPTPDEIHTLG